MADQDVSLVQQPQTAPIVQVLTPREPRQRVTRRLASVAVAGGRRAAQGARRVARAFRSAGGSIARRVGNSFARRKVKKAQIASSTRRKGSALLRIGKAAIGLLIGAGVAMGVDTALRRYVTTNKGARLAVNIAMGVGLWFIAPWAGPTWVSFLQAISIGHIVTGVIVIGVEAVNQAAESMPTPEPAKG